MWGTHPRSVCLEGLARGEQKKGGCYSASARSLPGVRGGALETSLDTPQSNVYNISLPCFMHKPHKESFCFSYQSLYQQTRSPLASHLREPAGHLAEKWTELEWQAMWYSGAFGTTFRTVSGSLVEIIQFGFWNREPGPDFVHASLRLDGEKLLEGDIELDIHVADWDRHSLCIGKNIPFRNALPLCCH